MTTLNAKSKSYGRIGRFWFKLGALAGNDQLFEEGKVYELLEELRKKRGWAKEVTETIEERDERDLPFFFRYEKLSGNSCRYLLRK
jgi:uncharacterized protein YjbJ (UPF0337 family)